MNSVYVSGCAGFVASNLVRHLLQAGCKVGGCDNMMFGYESNLPKGFKYSQKGIHECHYEANEYDILVHCATANIIYAQDCPVLTHITNTIDTIELFNAFHGKVIYTSTSSVYGNCPELPTNEDSPIQLTNSYARSKYAAELFLKDRGNYTTLRLTNTYGRNQRPDHAYSGVIGKALNAMIKGGEITIYGSGEQTRDFVYVDDVCDAILCAIEQEPKNTEINIGTGKETSIGELLNTADQLTTGEWTVNRVEPRSIDNIQRRCLDNSRAKKLLGWSPKTSLSDGLKKTIDWLSTL